ncbi:RagB/SusD family nutrient uptake outer membrane protein [Belliella aquatica]|uniref:Membrane protein n=1 Tax=Belliella aquatica TaxID=1323734 RepID=A0ABQ1LNV2_9BACT|nr:RagB/SusD family nutrient uptake outer membrane protein [Belliella aquatica]MCH7404357.1 RagB/SusD family nutrient uptake outer membrane protein [Belliella aquatica]GGC27377.1 membrane protein [Belliella aquatica]
MLKKYINTFLIALLLIMSTSCDGWLDMRPINGVVKQDYWKTKEQVRASMFGAYASLNGNFRGRQNTEMMFLWGELRAYMVGLNQGANFNDTQIIFGNIQPVNNIADWASFYGTINLCNLVVDYAPLALETDQTFREADMKNYVAEARALRALMYFYLVRTFGEVPLVIDAVDTDEDELAPAKSSKEAVLAQILEDLRLAEVDIYEGHETPAASKGRMTKYAVNAIQADVHLWMENYDLALQAADKVLAGPYGLVPQENWARALFIEGNSVESIFEIQYQTPQNNPFFQMFSMDQGRRFIAYPTVLEDIFGFDPDRVDDIDLRSIDASLKPSGEIFKYTSLGPNTRRAATESFANWIVYRLADVMLMKAEALSQLDRGAEALEIVALIRERGGASESTLENPADTDSEGILRYILNERARELAFEGKRWFDLLRIAKMNNYSNLDVLISVAIENAPVTNLNSIINQLRDTRSHYLPIFNEELNANPNLVQNEYYLR